MPRDFTLRRFAVAWLLGAIGTFLILAVLTGMTLANHGWWGYFRLVQEGTTADGVITRVEPENHRRAEYVFVVRDVQYRGGVDGFGGKVGQSVVVTYLPTNPNLSCEGDARDRLNNELATFAVGGVMFPPLLILALRRRKRAR